MSHDKKNTSHFDTLQHYGENPYECGVQDSDAALDDMDMDDRTFQYISHMNKSKLIPDKWPESTSTMLNNKTLFTNENINNRQYKQDDLPAF
jgi:hypothetical protein